MTIASEITRIKTAIADAYTACQDMGATMPAVLNSNNLEQCIASISGGQPVLQHWYNLENENDLAVKKTIATPIDNKLYIAANYKLLEIGSPSVYTLDQNPITSSVVYDLPDTPSALTITGVGTGTITLSDSNTYTYNAEGDIEQ